MQLETARLILRPLQQGDLDGMLSVLGDPDTMAFFPEPYSRERLKVIIQKQMQLFETKGYGLFAVIEKDSGHFIGECGITVQDIDGHDELEIGYCFAKETWGLGFAPEAAAAMRDYGFEQLGLEKLYSYMASDHLQSRRVAEKIGMTLEKEYRNPNNRNFPTTIYAISYSEFQKTKS